MKLLDVCDATAAVLRAAGFGDVCFSVPNGKSEGVAVLLAPSPAPTVYYDGTMECDYSVEVYVKREREARAAAEADAVEIAVAAVPPDSLNGSYRLTSADVGAPRPVAWDDSGYYVWLAPFTIHATRKEF